MSKIITLKRIAQVTERDAGYPSGSIRFYISNIFLGRAVPKRHEPYLFYFENVIGEAVIRTASEAKSFEDIVTDIELSLKEFTSKTVKWVK